MVEAEMIQQFPVIVEMANQLNDFGKDDYNSDRLRYERRTQVKEILGRDYYEPVHLMINIRQKVSHHIEEIRKRLHKLDDRIGGY